jgi:hypothetical protein
VTGGGGGEVMLASSFLTNRVQIRILSRLRVSSLEENPLGFFYCRFHQDKNFTRPIRIPYFTAYACPAPQNIKMKNVLTHAEYQEKIKSISRPEEAAAFSQELISPMLLNII